MVQVQQRLLIAAALLALGVPVPAEARRFYPDDPIQRMPRPLPVPEANERKLSEYYDFFYNTFGKPGENHENGRVIRAQAVNTLGEVPDSAWYTNRHRNRRMSIEELVRGPGDKNNPTGAGPWNVTGAKTEGITPGFTVRDARGRRYLLKFDPMRWPELASGAEVIGTKFFYALGYNVPENYVVYFRREDLRMDPSATLVDDKGRERQMAERDIDLILERVPRDGDGRYRALASLFLQGKPIGPFRYHGTRADDPNDIFPHEHRRDLRGLYVFAAWLNHNDTKSINSLDTLVEDSGVKFIRHHLIDFGATLGSDSFEEKSPRAGNVYLFDWAQSAKSVFTAGLWVPRWAFADFPDIKGVGNIESEVFRPAKWKNNYYNAAFVNCLPDDAFWAAKQIMAFTEPEIRAIVASARFSEPQAVDYLTKTLIERQRKIGEVFLSTVLPLDRFRVEQGQLAFDDLGVQHKLAPARNYSISWFRFDNEAGTRTPLSGASGLRVPSAQGEYLAAEIHGGEPRKNVVVYLRKSGSTWEPVGIDRNW